MGTTAAAAVTRQSHPEYFPSYLAAAYIAQRDRWNLCRVVMQGTDAVRSAQNIDDIFPRGIAESEDERAARAKRAEFFPMFKETVKGLTGLAFRKDPKLGDDVPTALVNLCENIDGAGTAMPVFARRVFYDGMQVGHAGILVDVQRVTAPEGRRLTLREERALGVRPYWVHVRAEQMINWRTTTINGKLVLTLLVIMEETDEDDGTFGAMTVTRYRVFRRDKITGKIHFEVWVEPGENKDPVKERDGELVNMPVIPFTVVYCGERIAPLVSMPPLLDLAYTSIAHVQVLSDHRTSLHAAGNPILVIKGRTNAGRPGADPMRENADNERYFTEGPGAGPAPDAIVVSSNSGIEVDKDGDVKYAEHAGSALNASATEITAIENRGAAQGLAMLQRSVRAAQTAEAEAMQRNEKDASLSSAVRSMEDNLEIALAFTALYLNLESGGSVDMDREFEQTVIDTSRVQALSSATAAGQFTLETFWTLLIRGGVLPGNFDMEAEREKLTQQAAITLTATDGGGGSESSAADDVGDEQQQAA